MGPAGGRSEETKKYDSHITLSAHRLIIAVTIAVTMSSLPTLAKISAPSSFRCRNRDSLVAVLNHKPRGGHSLTSSYKSKRTQIYQRRDLQKDSPCSFTPTFSFTFNKHPPSSRIKTQSPPPTSRHHSSSALPHSGSNISRHTTSLINSCTPASNTDETTDLKVMISQKISPGTTVYDALRSSLQLLEDHSVPEPDESVLHLLSHALNLSWEDGYRQLREILALPSPIASLGNSGTSRNQPMLDLAQQALTSEQSKDFYSLLERRLKFEPLQYIVGRWDFHYLTGLKIKKPMLCPRPETEELVELVLADIGRLIEQKNIQPDGNRKIRVLDVGCGTGAIGIAIAHRYPKHVRVVALDVLPEAVDLSNENADAFLSGSIGDNDGANDGAGGPYRAVLCSARDFTNNPIEPAGARVEQKYKMSFDIVVSNPPYVPTNDMRDLSADVVEYESHAALCGGDDGLDVIRDIVHRLPEWTSPTGADPRNCEPRHCWMEVDDSHPSMMAQWLAPGSKESTSLGVEYRKSCKDLYGRDRFVLLSIVQHSPLLT